MSRDAKRRMIWYQVDDAEAVARQQERMEAKGWRLTAMDNWYYTYRRCEPAQVKYAVAFFPDASFFDSAMPAGQETYLDYCHAAGWELAAAYGPVQCFRAARPDPTPIETDEAFRLRAVRRTMRKSYVLSYTLLLLIPLIGFPMLLGQFRREPLEFFSRMDLLAETLILAGILLFSGGMLLDYLVWILRSKRSVARGGTCVKPHTRARLWGSAATLAVCCAGAAVFFFAETFPGSRKIFLFYLLVYGGIMGLSRPVLRLIKRHSEQRGTVIAAYACFAVAVGLVMGFFLVPAAAEAFQGGERETYTYYVTQDGGITLRVYHDPLPVTLEDIGYSVTENDHCSCRAEVRRSPFASSGQYTQTVLDPNSELPDLQYHIYESPWTWLLERQWRALLAGEADSPFPLREADAAPWGAAEVFQLDDMNAYYLRFPEQIMTVRLGREAGPRQTAALISALREGD